MVGNITFSGRLGNHMLQVAGAAVFAEQLNLYMSEQWINFPGPGIDMDDFLNYFELNPELFSCGIYHEEPKYLVTDRGIENNSDLSTYPQGCYSFETYFADKKFLNKYINTIHRVFQCKKPIEKKPRQILVHCRIGDVCPPMTATPEFYNMALEQMEFTGGVIATEVVNEPFIQDLCKKFGLHAQCFTPGETLAQSYGYDSMVLDQGTFSWWLGVLGQAKQVIRYVSPPERSFCPDISLDHWKLIPYTETINNHA